MDKEYKINHFFNEDGKVLDELIQSFLLSFLENEFNLSHEEEIVV